MNEVMGGIPEASLNCPSEQQPRDVGTGTHLHACDQYKKRSFDQKAQV